MRSILPYLDPYAAASDPTAQNRFNELLIEQFRANSGVTGQFTSVPVLLLTTAGARSGRPRTTPLVYLRDREEDRDRYLIVASKTGAPTNPGWYHNLLATRTATVEVGNECFDASARVAHGDGRDQLFHKITTHYPIYQDYQDKTGRRIPVIILERTHRSKNGPRAEPSSRNHPQADDEP
jgi:deazaflavin-dependent oxidoreductase (nitroreductase family)